MATRKRDFFRLTKRDQKDLKTLLYYSKTIPAALSKVEGKSSLAPNAVNAFERLRTKYWFRLHSYGR